MIKRLFLALLIFSLITLYSCAGAGDDVPEEGAEGNLPDPGEGEGSAGEESAGEENIGGEEHTHAFGAWVVVYEADCEHAGARMRACECGESELDEIAPLGHRIERVEGTFPTCTAAGYADYERCIECNYSTFTEIPPKGHEVGEIEKIDPTCTADGELITYCKSCCTIMSRETISKNEHIPSDMILIDAESHASLCETCKITLRSEAHTIERKTVTPATYTECGMDILVCRVCNSTVGSITTDVLPKEKPEFTIPEGITVEYGTFIQDVSLPLGFSFFGDNPSFFDRIGEVSCELIYTDPNDTVGRYESVTGIWITVTVVKKTVFLDAKAPNDKVYDGEPIAPPTVITDLVELVRVSWYRNDRKLDAPPTAAGEYTVIVGIDHEFYTAEKKSFAVRIEKSPDPFGSFNIPNAVYNGKPVVIDLSGFEGVPTLILTDANGQRIDNAIDYGDYIATISVAESENYLSATGSFPFSVTTDMTPPTIVGDSFLYLDPGILDIPMTDNVGIDYFEITDIYSWLFGSETRAKSITLLPGHCYEIYAVDTSGNRSERLMVFVNSSYVGDDGYTPEICPQNGAVVHNSYVFFSASDANRIYFGEDPNDLSSLDSFSVGGLRNGVTYYWYAECISSYSPMYSFTVSYSAGTTPVPDYPINGAVINDKRPVFSARCSVDYEIYYKPYGYSDDYYRRVWDHYVTLEYGRTYVWYAISSAGERSEEITFTYLPENLSENPEGMWFVGGGEVEYINTSFFVVRASSIVGISRIRYYIEKADGTYSSFNYTSANVGKSYHNLDGTNEFYDLIAGLSDGDTVYYQIVGGRYEMAYSEVRKVIVDLSSPSAGSAEITETDEGFEVSISVGSDVVGAIYSYRVSGGEWIVYDEDITITLEPTYQLIELRAIDAVGNVKTAHFTAGIPEILPPQIDVIGYTTDSISNETVRVILTPAQDGASYYFLNGERHSLTEAKTLSLARDGEYEIYTEVTLGNITVCSEAHTVRIDKTPPEVNGIIMRADMDGYVRAWYWFPGIVVGYDDLSIGINTTGVGDSNAIVIDPALTVDRSPVSYSYMVVGVNDEFKPLDKKNNFYLYNYAFRKTGKYTIRIRATDAAGNYSDYDVDWFVDVEGPTHEPGWIDRGEDGKGYLLRLDGISDDVSKCTKITAYVLNTEAYITTEGAIIEDFINEDGFDEFVYDASRLPCGDFYVVVFMLYDELENRTISTQFSFYKRDEDRVELTEDGLYFERYDDGYRLVSIKTDKSTLILPESYKGESYTVVTGALLYNTTVTEVVVPRGLRLDWSAFTSSKRVGRVYFCGSDTEWEEGGFASAFSQEVTVAFLTSTDPDDMIWTYSESGTPTVIPKESEEDDDGTAGS